MATCSLPAWSSGSSSEVSESNSLSSGSGCTLGCKMRWPAEPPRARTASKSLYYIIYIGWQTAAGWSALFGGFRSGPE